MKLNKSYLILAIPVIIVVVAIIFLIGRKSPTEQTYIVGMVETIEVDVASEIPGRLNNMFVDRGDYVKEGQLLATFKPKIVDAKVGQAEGVLDAARSMMQMAKNGARAEEKKAAKSQYEMAKSQFEFAQKTYDRFLVLYEDSIISKQEMDEIEFKYNAAHDQMNGAKAIYEMAEEGARKEQINAAEGQFLQAENVYKEALAYQEQLDIIAPVSGEISNKIAENGEVIAAGYPVFSIQIPEDAYVIIQLREDKMKQFQKGSSFMLRFPALGDEHYEFKVSYLSPMADFATWLPIKQREMIELRTFEVHLKPVKRIKELKPGMTAVVEL